MVVPKPFGTPPSYIRFMNESSLNPITLRISTISNTSPYLSKPKWFPTQPHISQSKYKSTSKNLISDNLENKEVKLGPLSAPNFSNALLMLPSSFLNNVIVDVDHLHIGYAAFAFFRNGAWQEIIIDTLLPYSHQKKQLLFSSNSSSKVFFVALLEKAYAKLCKGYDQLNVAPIPEIVVDLTNGVFTPVPLSYSSESVVML